MIVEFIGSTGAGKTTLISQVRGKLAEITEVTTPFDLIAAPLGLGRVNHPSAQNLIQEFIGLPFFINSLNRHKAFISFSLKLMARQDHFTLHSLNYLRSLERKIGVYEVNERFAQDQIILVDEGPVLTAHIVFVYTCPFYTADDMARFASLVPLPDVIIYVKAPIECLIKRSLQRVDPPRELRSKNRSLVEKYINNAVKMFDQLVQTERIQRRVLIVDNPEFDNQGCNKTAENIIEFIQAHRIFPKHTDTKYNTIIC